MRDGTCQPLVAEEWDKFFNLSPDIMCVTGFDGCFKRMSPAVTAVLGYAAADLLDRSCRDFVHPEDLGRTRDEVDIIVGGSRTATQFFRNRFLHRDGSFRWLEWHSNTVAKDRLIFSVVRDVTEQTAIEERVQLYATELERSNAELQQFAYVASHDLQEPLRAVAGCVQMLHERNAGKLDERSVELIDHAVDGAKRLQALINDLLSLSRVGSKGITKTWFDSRLAVEKAVAQLQGAVEEASATITIEMMPHLSADFVQLTQLFQNLIGNAIKFRSHERRADIRIAARQEDGMIVFSVSDNGIGISPEYYDRIFGVFQRLNSRREYSGTGIGLAICKKIVERHEGRIWVEAGIEGGSTFRVAIPVGKHMQ